MTVIRILTGRLWIALATSAVLAVAVGAWLLLARSASPVRARQYLNVSACLLTPRTGITQGSAAAAWTSMESASRATHVMVSYLAGTGPADVPVLLNTLVQRRCGVIITADADPAPVLSAAREYPGQRFLVVTAADLSGQPAPANVGTASLASAPTQIQQAMRELSAAS